MGLHRRVFHRRAQASGLPRDQALPADADKLTTRPTFSMMIASVQPLLTP